MAAPANEQLALKALAPAMLAQIAAYEAEDAALRVAEQLALKESHQSLNALAPLKRLYEESRIAIAARRGRRYPAASSFSAPDDLLHVVEDMEDEL